MDFCYPSPLDYEKIHEQLHCAEVFKKQIVFPFFISDDDSLLEFVRKPTGNSFFFTRLCIGYFRRHLKGIKYKNCTTARMPSPLSYALVSFIRSHPDKTISAGSSRCAVEESSERVRFYTNLVLSQVIAALVLFLFWTRPWEAFHLHTSHGEAHSLWYITAIHIHYIHIPWTVITLGCNFTKWFLCFKLQYMHLRDFSYRNIQIVLLCCRIALFSFRILGYLMSRKR